MHIYSKLSFSVNMAIRFMVAKFSTLKTTAGGHFSSTSFQFLYRTCLFYSFTRRKCRIAPRMDAAIVQRKIQISMFFHFHWIENCASNGCTTRTAAGRGGARRGAAVRGGARLCAAVHGGARRCTAVRGCAQRCAAVRGDAWRCAAVHGGARKAMKHSRLCILKILAFLFIFQIS